MVIGRFLLCIVESLGCDMNPLAALFMLQSLLSARCSFLQFGQLLCGHGEWVIAHLQHVWSRSWCDSPHHLHLYFKIHAYVLCVRLQHFRHCHSVLCLGIL
jgi:hypothetical protein